jgi:hypothetical protein
MGWRLLVSCSVAMVLSACGVLGGGAAAPAPPTSAPATVAAPSSVPAAATRDTASPIASPAPRPTATALPAAQVATTVWVGNTDGEGVYVRKTPVMADRAKPYPDGTALTIVGDDVDGDGQHWKHIKTPDGLEGYVPSIYTVATRP